MKGTKLICDQCRLPVAEVVGDVVVIHSRHHGRKHTTCIPISMILEAAKVTVDIDGANTVE